VSGLRCRGGFVIDELSWKDGKITSLKIRSTLGGNLRLRLPADEDGNTGITLTSSGTLTDAQGTNPNPLMQVYDIADPIVKDAKKIPATILSPTRLYDIATTTGETVEFKAR
jgi:alpha-L-fucosidase 2